MCARISFGNGIQFNTGKLCFLCALVKGANHLVQRQGVYVIKELIIKGIIVIICQLSLCSAVHLCWTVFVLFLKSYDYILVIESVQHNCSSVKWMPFLCRYWTNSAQFLAVMNLHISVSFQMLWLTLPLLENKVCMFMKNLQLVSAATEGKRLLL